MDVDVVPCAVQAPAEKGWNMNPAPAAQPTHHTWAQGMGGSQRELWGVSLPMDTETRSGSKWDVYTVQEQGGADQELVTLGVFGALGNWWMFVLGLGLFPFLWGLPLSGLLCVGDGMRRVLPHRRGFGLSLLEVGEDADSDDEGGQGDGVAHGVHQVQAVKHLLEEKD